MVVVKCGKCSNPIQLPATAGTNRFRCPHCKSELTVSLPASPPVPAPAPRPVVPAPVAAPRPPSSPPLVPPRGSGPPPLPRSLPAPPAPPPARPRRPRWLIPAGIGAAVLAGLVIVWLAAPWRASGDGRGTPTETPQPGAQGKAVASTKQEGAERGPAVPPVVNPVPPGKDPVANPGPMPEPQPAPPPRDQREDPPGVEVPMIFVQLQSLNRIKEVVRFVASAVKEEAFFEALVQKMAAQISKEGAQGIDPNKPWGLYVRKNEGDPVATLVVVAPVRNERGFRRLMQDVGFAEKNQDHGVWYFAPPAIPRGFPIQIGLPPQIGVRFSDGYAHFCINGKLGLIVGPNVLRVGPLFARQEKKLLSATLRIDRLPADFGKKWLAGIDEKRKLIAFLGNPVVQKFADTVADKLRSCAMEIVADGRELAFDLDLNEKAQALSVNLSLRGKKGSQLARDLAELANIPSTVGALALADAAFSVLLHVQLPAEVRKQLPAVIGEATRQTLAKITNAQERREHERLFRTLGDTFAAGKLDLAVAVRSLDADKSRVVVGGLGVPNGKALDLLIQDTAAELKDKDFREAFEFGVAELAGVKVHRVNIQKTLQPLQRQMVGDNPLYYAFRPDAVFWTMGSHGKQTLERALAIRPGRAPLALLALNIRELTKMTAFQLLDPQVTRVHLTKEHPGRVRLELAGGEALRLSAHVDLNLFRILPLSTKGP